MRKFLMTAVTACVACATAQAAEPAVRLLNANGKVLVNSGSGYVSVANNSLVAPGSTLFVGKGASAQLADAAGTCTMTVAEGTVYTVPAVLPCQAGQDVAMAGDAVITPTFGIGGGAELSHFVYMLPVVAIVGGVVVLATSYDSPEPAPPLSKP